MRPLLMLVAVVVMVSRAGPPVSTIHPPINATLAPFLPVVEFSCNAPVIAAVWLSRNLFTPLESRTQVGSDVSCTEEYVLTQNLVSETETFSLDFCSTDSCITAGPYSLSDDHVIFPSFDDDYNPNSADREPSPFVLSNKAYFARKDAAYFLTEMSVCPYTLRRLYASPNAAQLAEQVTYWVFEGRVFLTGGLSSPMPEGSVYELNMTDFSVSFRYSGSHPLCPLGSACDGDFDKISQSGVARYEESMVFWGGMGEFCTSSSSCFAGYLTYVRVFDFPSHSWGEYVPVPSGDSMLYAIVVPLEGFIRAFQAGRVWDFFPHNQTITERDSNFYTCVGGNPYPTTPFRGDSCEVHRHWIFCHSYRDEGPLETCVLDALTMESWTYSSSVIPFGVCDSRGFAYAKTSDYYLRTHMCRSGTVLGIPFHCAPPAPYILSISGQRHIEPGDHIYFNSSALSCRSISTTYTSANELLFNAFVLTPALSPYSIWAHQFNGFALNSFHFIELSDGVSTVRSDFGLVNTFRPVGVIVPPYSVPSSGLFFTCSQSKEYFLTHQTGSYSTTAVLITINPLDQQQSDVHITVEDIDSLLADRVTLLAWENVNASQVMLVLSYNMSYCFIDQDRVCTTSPLDVAEGVVSVVSTSFVAVGDELFIVGGLVGDVHVAAVQIVDLQQHSVVKVPFPDGMSGRHSCTLYADGDAVYIFGGTGAGDSFLSDLWTIDVPSRQFSRISYSGSVEHHPTWWIRVIEGHFYRALDPSSGLDYVEHLDMTVQSPEMQQKEETFVLGYPVSSSRGCAGAVLDSNLDRVLVYHPLIYQLPSLPHTTRVHNTTVVRGESWVVEFECLDDQAVLLELKIVTGEDDVFQRTTANLHPRYEVSTDTFPLYTNFRVRIRTAWGISESDNLFIIPGPPTVHNFSVSQDKSICVNGENLGTEATETSLHLATLSGADILTILDAEVINEQSRVCFGSLGYAAGVVELRVCVFTMCSARHIVSFPPTVAEISQPSHAYLMHSFDLHIHGTHLAGGEFARFCFFRSGVRLFPASGAESGDFASSSMNLSTIGQQELAYVCPELGISVPLSPTQCVSLSHVDPALPEQSFAKYLPYTVLWRQQGAFSVSIGFVGQLLQETAGSPGWNSHLVSAATTNSSGSSYQVQACDTVSGVCITSRAIRGRTLLEDIGAVASVVGMSVTYASTCAVAAVGSSVLVSTLYFSMSAVLVLDLLKSMDLYLPRAFLHSTEFTRHASLWMAPVDAWHYLLTAGASGSDADYQFSGFSGVLLGALFVFTAVYVIAEHCGNHKLQKSVFMLALVTLSFTHSSLLASVLTVLPAPSSLLQILVAGALFAVVGVFLAYGCHVIASAPPVQPTQPPSVPSKFKAMMSSELDPNHPSTSALATAQFLQRPLLALVIGLVPLGIIELLVAAAVEILLIFLQSAGSINCPVRRRASLLRSQAMVALLLCAVPSTRPLTGWAETAVGVVLIFLSYAILLITGFIVVFSMSKKLRKVLLKDASPQSSIAAFDNSKQPLLAREEEHVLAENPLRRRFMCNALHGVDYSAALRVSEPVPAQPKKKRKKVRRRVSMKTVVQAAVEMDELGAPAAKRRRKKRVRKIPDDPSPPAAQAPVRAVFHSQSALHRNETFLDWNARRKQKRKSTKLVSKERGWRG